ncbi:MAG: carboxypeptidase regulatory-like domain-containing protein, partial [Blastocatellia bacterium]
MSPKSKFVSLFLSFALLATQLSLPVFAIDSGRHAIPDTITGTLTGKAVLGEAGKIFNKAESNERPRVPGVRIRITNQETGNVRTMQTDAKGEYRFALVPMGNYKV